MRTCGTISCDQCNEEREILAKAILKAHNKNKICVCDTCILARAILQEE